MDDKALRQFIIDELEFEPSVDSASIGVAVEKGVVTLIGHVRSYAEKIAVEDAVQRIKGVRALAEELEVRYPYEKKAADDQIAERAVNLIAWNAMIPEGLVRIKVQHGWVTLEGTLDWQFQRYAAEDAIRRLSGVVGVHNMIKVNPRVQPADVKAKILAALKRDAELEAGSIVVDVKGDRVVLEGKVKAWHERRLAERAAWSAPGVASVEDNLRIG